MGLLDVFGLKGSRTLEAKRYRREVTRLRGLVNPNYPSTVNSKAEPQTVAAIARLGCRCVAEFGVLDGNTSLAIARVLDGKGELHLFDFEHNVEKAVERLRNEGFSNVHGHGTSTRLLDSYNWSLSKLIEANPSPMFDYAFIDGAHTWCVDALTFFLVDRLLVVGGHIDFDDYNWTLRGSSNLSPDVFPLTGEMYTDEQIDDKQVKRIVELLVKRDPRYIEVAANKLYRKVA